jgi:hypothetical protein
MSTIGYLCEVLKLEIESSSGYEPPTVASTQRIKSSYSTNPNMKVVSGTVKIDLNLAATKKVVLKDYLDLYPKRAREDHWILAPGWAAAFRPLTSTPFWFNQTGKTVCQICDGKHRLRDLFSEIVKTFPAADPQEVIREVFSFILLLEELDLIEFWRELQ